MLVYHFNTSLNGGAAAAARRIHDSLVTAGVQSYFFYKSGEEGSNHSTYSRLNYRYLQQRLSDKIRDRFNGKYQFRKNFQKNLNHFISGKPYPDLFSYTRLPVETPLPTTFGKPDLVHLHWVSELFDFPSFFSSIPDDLPIVWTLHDMNAFTGGCHYSRSCDRFVGQCGCCPQLNENRSESDISYEGVRIKSALLKNKHLHVVACCNWLENCSKASKVFSRAESFQTIHYGIDSNAFIPREKSTCKRALLIDENEFVIVFGAHSIEDERKGFGVLIESLKYIKEKVTLLVFGKGRMILRNSTNVTPKFLGDVHTPELLSLIYSAADVVVIPSIQEALAQVCLEAMACGRPVIGSNIGGIPDMVIPEVTGLLAQPGNAFDLSAKIQWLLDNPTVKSKMGEQARRTIEKNFSLDLQTARYMKLYESLT